MSQVFPNMLASKEAFRVVYFYLSFSCFSLSIIHRGPDNEGTHKRVPPHSSSSIAYTSTQTTDKVGKKKMQPQGGYSVTAKRPLYPAWGILDKN